MGRRVFQSLREHRSWVSETMERKRRSDPVTKCKIFESNFRYLIEFTPFQAPINCAPFSVNFVDNFRRGRLRSRSFYHQIGSTRKGGREDERKRGDGQEKRGIAGSAVRSGRERKRTELRRCRTHLNNCFSFSSLSSSRPCRPSA